MIALGYERRVWTVEEVTALREKKLDEDEAELGSRRTAEGGYLGGLKRHMSAAFDIAREYPQPQVSRPKRPAPYWDALKIEDALHRSKNQPEHPKPETSNDLLTVYAETYKARRREITPKSVSDLNRAVTALIEVAGDQQLGQYERRDGHALVEALAEAGQARATITKKLVMLNGLFNDAVEREVIASNPFDRLPIRTGRPPNDRRPFTPEELHQIFRDAPFSAEEHLVASLLVSTGCRLTEIIGLKAQEVRQIDGVPVIDLEAAGRRLKTKTSRRRVPVHPDVAPQLQAYVANLTGDAPVFPGFPSEGAASKTLLRRLRAAKVQGVTHQFRHTFKRLCRDAGIPEEVHDQITGHANHSVGRGYGAGASLRTLYEAVCKVKHPWLLPEP